MADSDFNIDLILALADGSMEPDAAAAAEAALSPAEREELAAHRVALAALADAPDVRLRDAERADLRASVRAEINLPDAPEAVAAPASPRPTPWYTGLLPALGAAAALVLVVGIAINLGDRGGDDSAEDFATDAPAAEQLGDVRAVEDTTATTAAASAAESAVADDGSFQEEAAGDDSAAPTTTAAAATTTTAADEAPVDRSLPRVFPPIGDYTSEDLADRVADEIVDVFADIEGYPFDVALVPFIIDASTPPPLVCADVALEQVEEATSVIGAGIGTFDGGRAEIYGFETDGGLVAVVVAAPSCEPVAIVPG